MINELIAEHLKTLSYLFQIKGEARRFSSYSRAAEIISSYREEITKENVSLLYGVGKSLSTTILQFKETGTSDKYQEIIKEIDPQCLSMLVVKGIGPKTAWKFYQSDIKNFNELVSFWKDGNLDPRFNTAIKQAIERKGERIPNYLVQIIGNNLLELVSACPGVIRSSLAGSVRRKKETSKDLDIILSVTEDKYKSSIIDYFTNLGTVISMGDTKSSIWFSYKEITIQTDLLVVDDECFGSALQYFTGSKEHNIKIRTIAQSKGLKVNEFGIFDKSGKKLGGKNEKDIYDILGIDMPEPENR